MTTVKGENRYSFLATDTETEELVEINENGEIVWKIDTALTVFDLWHLGGDRILFCHYGRGGSGARIIDRKGNILFQYTTENEIFSCQPLDNGGVLVGELRQKRLVETDDKGNISKIIPFDYRGADPHETMRSARKLPNGTYMIVSPGSNKIFFLDESGNILREFDTRPNTFGAVVRPNGNVVYSCMDGLAELDASGNEVWTLLEKDVPEINIRWLLGIHIRKNGNIVCNNWLGHGHNGEGVPVFEVTPDKKIVWQCDCRERLPNLGNFYLLGDGDDEEIAKTPRR